MRDLTFVIPIRHPDNLRNPDAQLHILNQTFPCYSAQTADSWRVVLIANRGTLLPKLPRNFEIVWVDFAPNPQHELKDHEFRSAMNAVLLDKGRRIGAGMRAFPDSHYFMLMDDDDFVSRRLTEFVRANRGENGWYVNRGYGVGLDGSLAMALERFHKISGSSHIMRGDLLPLPDPDDPAYDPYVMKWLGTHGPTTELFEEIGKPLAPLPFPGAIYLVNNPNSHSISNALVRQYVLNKDTLRRPWTFFEKFSRLKRIDNQFRAEFFGKP